MLKQMYDNAKTKFEESKLYKMLEEKAKEMGLYNIEHRWIIAPVRALRGRKYNYSVVCSRPRTTVLEGVTYEQADKLRTKLEERIREEFIKQLEANSRRDTKTDKGTGTT